MGDLIAALIFALVAVLALIANKPIEGIGWLIISALYNIAYEIGRKRG